MKPIFQMTREEKLQEIVEYSPCRVERSAVLRYLLAVRRNDTEQIAYFESFGKSVRQIILNVRTYERGLIFGYAGKQFNEHGWINGMLPIIEEIKLDTLNTIHIGQSIDGTYAVSIDWSTGYAGGGSHPSVWDEPIRNYKKAVRQGIRLLEQQYCKAERWSVSDRSNYNPKIIRKLKARLVEFKQRYTQPQQLSLF
ncbi:MAG: hypothetical protein LUD46_14445 [Parabacteroides sp.]|nr:hypothetical protein [Parabacteroides sp.]